MTMRTQAPIGSGFSRDSTADEVAAGHDLAGRRYVVTGGYSGLGLETVRVLAAAGAEVTVPARSRARAEAALAGLAGRIVVAEMDLADVGSVRRFAADYAGAGGRLDGLINNAGVMACPLERVGPGWEMQFAVCHLGHAALAAGLERSLKATEGARVVALSSIGHARSDVLWDDPHFARTPYDKWVAYGQAKTANALFALGTDMHWAGQGVRAFSVHPGGIFTPLQRHLPDEEMVALGWKAPDGSIPPQVQAMFKTPAGGAATTVWCLLSPQLEGLGGLYCEDCDVAQAATDDSPRWAHARSWACSEGSAARLWDLTERTLAG